MARRESEVAKEQASAADTGGGAGPDEAATAAAETPTGDGIPETGPDPEDAAEAEAAAEHDAAEEATPAASESLLSAGRVERDRVPHPIPNHPSFDWVKDGKKRIPNLMKGEEVLDKGKRNDVPWVRTTGNRIIYLVTMDKFEEKIGPVPGRELYMNAFPQAVPKAWKPKAKK